MLNKVCIVGGVAGGASTAARLRRLSEDVEIIMFERGPNVSFSNCSLPFYLSRTVKESDDLIMMSSKSFLNRYNIQVRVNSEVLAINRQARTILVKDPSGKEYEESYDKLVLSPGALPVRPRSIEGIDGKHVFTVRNVEDITSLDSYIASQGCTDIAVIGGGFIGIEVAENLCQAGKKVSLIEAAPQILAPFDDDMVQMLHKEMLDNGIDLHVGDGVKSIGEDSVTLASGKSVRAQAVVLAIGVRPDTALASAAGLELGQTGGIKVDANYLTSNPDIYAVGDAIEVYSKLMGKPTRLTLAGPAQKQARAAADHMCGIRNYRKGVIGSSVLRVFDLNAASTGLNERQLDAAGIQHGFAMVIPSDKVGIMPDSHAMHFKLIYEYPTGRILGAQAVGKGAVDKRIDVVAAMIGMDATIEDLKDAELCYSPLFGTAKDVTNMAALVAENLLSGRFRQVAVSDVRELVEKGAYIIDVREKREYENGHIIGSHNIPLSEFRSHLDEIPRDIPVYLHCRSSQRSYNALMILNNSGFTNAYNIAGSYLGICNYEYFRDRTEGRKPIVTAYNFN